MLQASDYVAPTGKIITGSVLDCDKDALTRALQFYDKQLYLKWNPNKRKGWGCWEIRRAPEQKTWVFKTEFNGHDVCTLESVELDLVNHVMDIPHLNHIVLERLRKMDTWQDKRWVDNLEYREAAHKAEIEKKAKETLKYEIRQHKSEWREFAKRVAEGMNPGQVLSGKWGK